jgi:heavy metal sensor kinase
MLIMRMSLRLRLTLLTGLLTGAMLLFFALVFYLFLQASLFREIDAQLRERAALVTRSLATGGNLEDQTIPLTPSPLVEFAAPGIYVELLDLNGQVRAVSPNLSGSQLPIRLDLLTAARIGHAMIDTVMLDTNEELRLLVAPLRVHEASGSVLLVAESLKPLHRTLAQARTLLLVCGAAALTLAVGGAALMTAQSLAPMARLTRTAATVSETGHYHERVPIPRHQDEVGQLAITLNKLIATVEQTLAQQRRFVADTSHELRSPLTVVLANLNLLCRDLGAHERVLSLQEATAEAQRMRRLVNDLLLLAQADTAQAMAHTRVHLDQLVEESVATAARQAPEHCLRSQVEAPVVIIGDQERLTQLLRNLLENATHHTPPGTDVEVRLRRSDGVAQIVVTDTGLGIPAEHLPQIWNRFYRVDKARSRASGGTGLGLAIVKYVAEAHGGSVGVVSDVGKGTTFTITLPVVPTDSVIPDSGLPADLSSDRIVLNRADLLSHEDGVRHSKTDSGKGDECDNVG